MKIKKLKLLCLAIILAMLSGIPSLHLHLGVIIKKYLNYVSIYLAYQQVK